MLKKYDGTNWNTASYGKYFSGTEQFTNFPLVIRSLDQSVQAYTIKGNTQTSGTPSPSNPVTIEGVGEETANVYNNAETSWTSGFRDDDGIIQSSNVSYFTSNYTKVDEETEYTLSGLVVSGTSMRVYFLDGAKGWISRTSAYNVSKLTFTTPTDCKYIQIQCANTIDGSNFMVVKGATAPSSFIPYGYEISIVNDSSPLTPIYVSQPLMKIATTSDNVNSSDTVTYNIRKLVMDRNISITDSGTSGNYHRYSIRLDGCSNRGSEFSTDVITTHYRIQTGWGNGNAYLYSEFLFISLLDSEYPNSSALKSFFTAQYDAGTPVTVWYILATPTTESVTAPSIPTTDGTVTIDVDTTVKPSEVSLTYNGKHLNKSKKYNGNNWT